MAVTFGEFVRAHRERLNLTRKELAEKIQVSDSTIERYEGQNFFPRAVPLVKRLSVALQVPEHDLLVLKPPDLVLAEELSGHFGKRYGPYNKNKGDFDPSESGDMEIALVRIENSGFSEVLRIERKMQRPIEGFVKALEKFAPEIKSPMIKLYRVYGSEINEYAEVREGYLPIIKAFIEGCRSFTG